MYLKNIVINNIGPISDFRYDFKFKNDNPIPLVIIGENGKGKTILSSYIADLFIELAKKSYSNVVEVENAYYRVVGGTNVRAGVSSGYALINFDEKDINYLYYTKSGDINVDEESRKFSDFANVEEIRRHFSETDVTKKIVNLSNTEKIFDNNVLVFFPSYRNEKPNWMNLESIKYNSEYTSTEKINGILNKEIIIEHSVERNFNWLEKLLSDGRVNLEKTAVGSYRFCEPNGVTISSLVLIDNINSILCKILKKESKFQLNHRLSANRFSIISEDNIIPSIRHLSLGEAILFNLFCSIIRHGEKKHNISDICGVVVIDEIDMHLDSDMQYSVLPELISLFPKVQFVITSHSPLFLLGMKKKFADACEFIEMPDGKDVDVETFGEFKKAYDILKETKKYNDDVLEKVSVYLEKNKTVNPLIITEGSTDWMHMKNAFEKLCASDAAFLQEYKDIEFEFLEYTSKIGEANSIQMGDSALEAMCSSLSKYNPGRKIICIGDNDVQKYITKFNFDGSFKNWGNNVFSFTIPIPETRIANPNISIEHYYTDEEIKTFVNVDDISRRLFLGNEFNTDGFSNDDYYCQNKGKCGDGKNCILDGESGARVFKVSDMKNDDKINYALSKMDFITYIDTGQINISQESYENFKKIFYVIKDIIKNN